MQSADVFAEDPGFMLKVRQWAQEQGGSVGEDGVAQMCGSPEIVEGSFMPLPGRERSSRS